MRNKNTEIKLYDHRYLLYYYNRHFAYSSIYSVGFTAANLPAKDHEAKYSNRSFITLKQSNNGVIIRFSDIFMIDHR